jgi:hypothetical protein
MKNLIELGNAECLLGVKCGKTRPEHLLSAFDLIPDEQADIRAGRLSAMCGRLQVGKSFLHVSRLGRCSHVFGL